MTENHTQSTIYRGTPSGNLSREEDIPCLLVMRSHEPHGFSQGLVAVLHLNSEPGTPGTASTSQYATSRQHDKLPVLSHRDEPLQERSVVSQCTVLHPVAMEQPNSSFGGQCASRLSLWAIARIHQALGDTTECLSATRDYSLDWLVMQVMTQSKVLEQITTLVPKSGPPR